MVSNILKLSICAVSFAVMGVLGQQPLWAYNNTSLPSNSPQTRDTSNSAANGLLLDGTHNIQVALNTEVTEDEENIDSTNNDYTPSFIPQQPPTVSTAPLPPYIPYSNKWTNLSSTTPRKRRVPEPSALLGLMAIATCLGMQHKMKKG